MCTEDNAPPPHIILVGVDGTVLVAGSHTLDFGKAAMTPAVTHLLEEGRRFGRGSRQSSSPSRQATPRSAAAPATWRTRPNGQAVGRDRLRPDVGVPARIRTWDRRIRSPVTQSVSDDTAQGSEGGAAGDSTSDSTQPQDGPPMDPELAVVVAAWANLPAAVRAGIVAMVGASGAE